MHLRTESLLALSCGSGCNYGDLWQYGIHGDEERLGAGLADWIVANGGYVNEIGTNSVAVLAAYYRIPFYILAPFSTIDLCCPDGDEISIEFREPMAPEWMVYFSPASDVMEHSLATGNATGKGICYHSFEKSIAELLGMGIVPEEEHFDSETGWKCGRKIFKRMSGSQ